MTNNEMCDKTYKRVMDAVLDYHDGELTKDEMMKCISITIDEYDVWILEN